MNKEKNRGIIIIILCIIIAALCVLCILLATGKINFNRNSINNNQQTEKESNNNYQIEENIVENKEELKEDNTQTNITKENESLPYVVEAFNKDVSFKFPEALEPYDEEKNMILHKHVVLPKITIDTPNAKAFNDKIIKDYQYSINLANKEPSKYTTKEAMYSTYINYEYTINDDIIYILIELDNTTTRATGGTFHECYYYDIKADKELSVQDILKKYGITIDDINNNRKAENEDIIKSLDEIRAAMIIENIAFNIYIENTINGAPVAYIRINR